MPYISQHKIDLSEDGKNKVDVCTIDHLEAIACSWLRVKKSLKEWLSRSSRSQRHVTKRETFGGDGHKGKDSGEAWPRQGV